MPRGTHIATRVTQDISGLVDSVTATAPIVSSGGINPVISATSAVRDITTGNGVYSNGVASLAALAALPDASMAAGSVVHVEDQVFLGCGFQLVKTGPMAAATVDNAMVFATGSGAGRWVRTSYHTTFALSLSMGLVGI